MKKTLEEDIQELESKLAERQRSLEETKRSLEKYEDEMKTLKRVLGNKWRQENPSGTEEDLFLFLASHQLIKIQEGGIKAITGQIAAIRQQIAAITRQIAAIRQQISIREEQERAEQRTGNYKVFPLDQNRDSIVTDRPFWSGYLPPTAELYSVVDIIPNYMPSYCYIDENIKNAEMYADPQSTVPIKSAGDASDKIYIVVANNRQIVPQKDGVYEEYLYLGSLLKDHVIVQGLIETIQTLQNEFPVDQNSKSIPFIFLGGSSGIGKTQMAFTLMNTPIPIKYVLADTVERDRDQRIYVCFSSCTHSFLACVESDTKKYTDKTFSVGFFETPLLQTFGFILAYLKNKEYCGGPVTRDVVIDYLKTLDVKPVFFLDEFPNAAGEKEAKKNVLRFMRNIFRSLNLVTILASTNSSTANLVDFSSHSRGTDDIDKWCILIPRFPPYQLSTVYDPFFSFLLQNSRPLFSKFIADYLRRNPPGNTNLVDYMDKLTFELFKKAMAWKSQSSEAMSEFLSGQICMFLSAYEITCAGQDFNDPLINRHFANFLETSPLPLYIENGLKQQVGEQFEDWDVVSKFSPIKDDVLLYLSVMGGKFHHALQKFNRRIPLSKALDVIKGYDAVFENVDQTTYERLMFEAKICASIILASHCNGFHGIDLASFLKQLAYELGIISTDQVGFTMATGIRNLLQTIVPFLSPPNKEWPTALLASDLNLANFKQTPKCSRIEFESRLITGECKDYQSQLSIEQIKDILQRVPETSTIHLVLLTNLPPWSSLSGSVFNHFKGFLVCKLMFNGRSLSLKTSNNKRKRTTYQKAVIFISLDESFYVIT